MSVSKYSDDKVVAAATFRGVRDLNNGGLRHLLLTG
jgi:hypothetical protein